MDDILVSVIVPIYNVEKYLARCLDSIISQTYSNLEIILVDDGSIDSSLEIANEYADKDKRIKVLHKENGGLSDARNHGIEVATGKYICFIDSDDAISNAYVEYLLGLCEKNNCEISICGFKRVVDEDFAFKSEEESTIKIFSNIEALEAIYSERNVQMVVAWNKLYLTSLFDSVRFPKGKIHEDEATTYRLLYNANKVVISTKELYQYYVNCESITGSKYSLKRLNILDAIEGRMTFFKENELDELYFKDSYKYLCKILTSYYQVSHMEEKHPDIKRDLMKKYKIKLKECLEKDSSWSIKRRISMRFFSILPITYSMITGKR